jgi:3,4-dihydroxy 2-butanone 4-phosphate synthase/GTP cyclohydrolase II
MRNMVTILSPIEDIIADIRAGKAVIIVDDEDRENEGDIIVAAQAITPELINFMAKEARGLICLPMERAMVDRLGLQLMGRGDNLHHQTAFTESIEAKEGVTTGISAADRAHTILTAINPESAAEKIATPGHVFPLIACDDGVLERNGHTEAAVDLSKLAGYSGAGVICEIMNDDGTMARLDDLVVYAKKHDLKIGTIADLIAYRQA